MNLSFLRFRGERFRILVRAAVTLAVVVYGVYLGTRWIVMRVYVPHDKALLVINKFGDPLPPDRLVVPRGEEHYKGVREEVLGPGRYFFNPISYDTELVDLVKVPAGEPENWSWTPEGMLKDKNTAPMVGLVVVNEGKTPASEQEVVDIGYKGVQREVLTPGTYKINPKRAKVDLMPAVVVPPGSVGVVTRLIGDTRDVDSAPIVVAITTGPTTGPSTIPSSRLVVGARQRGILKDVLQPGIYYLNPRLVKVSVMPVGYDEITLEAPRNPVHFLSSDGYQVEADVTVVWGRTPADVPSIVATIGNTDDVRVKVVEQALRAACQNEGANYNAQDLIQGKTRTRFQEALSASLDQQVASRHVHVLLALIRNIQIRDGSGADQSEGLLATIQRANIEIERELTNKQKTQTAMVTANHQEALKLVDVARETVASETNVRVANIAANAQKKAAEIGAQREVDVAGVELQIAQLDAQRILILGKAAADVDRLKNEADAKGAKMLVDAFGSPQAYNQYIFAKNFEPTELRMIFAGPGTFWTDLKTFQEIGAGQSIQKAQEKK